MFQEEKLNLLINGNISLFSCFRSVLVTAAFLGSVLFAPAVIAQDVEDADHGRVPDFKMPEKVPSDGAFRYSLSCDVPAFRGLDPELGICYAPSFKNRSRRAEVWLGAGWQISGFSSTERVSVDGGTPTYDDAWDLYRLDGVVEPPACANAAASGNLAPLVEDHRRVRMLQEDHEGQQIVYFMMTGRNGPQYRHGNLDGLAGDPPGLGTAAHDILFERKLLLSEVRNPQAAPSAVTSSYVFDPVEAGRAHRPHRISYGSRGTPDPEAEALILAESERKRITHAPMDEGII